MADSVIQLKCYCNNYPWGKKGQDSLAAKYCASTPGTDFKLEDGKEYAEMWMGTYPTTPSYVLSTGELLQDVLNANKDKLIGKTVLDKFGADLPFLPKILSMAKALPLQIHPDKDLATRLHQKDPEKYGDTNHKPEIAVALTTFELFVGFKPLNEIQSLLQLPPLRQFIPNSQTHFNNETLKQICATMLTASESTVRNVTAEMLKLPEDLYGKQTHIPALLPRLQADYTDADNGILVALICMNYLVLQPGEAVYVPADGIHAWLSGDIVECMARSDNVINTGFCPRADRDSIELFTAALTFSPHSSDEARLDMSAFEGSKSGATRIYAPPMSEFNMLITQMNAEAQETVKAVQGPSIMIVTSGKGKMTVGGHTHDLDFGYIFFIGQGMDVEFATQDEKIMVYRAYAE